KVLPREGREEGPETMIPSSYVLAASLLVTDAGGKSPLKPIAKDGAVAIAGDEFCASLLVQHSFLESGWNLAAVGDGGKSHGPFQDQTLSRSPKTWAEAVSSFGRLLHRASVCETPLEMLAQGRCGEGAGRTIAFVRLAKARSIALRMRFYDFPGR